MFIHWTAAATIRTCASRVLLLLYYIIMIEDYLKNIYRDYRRRRRRPEISKFYQNRCFIRVWLRRRRTVYRARCRCQVLTYIPRVVITACAVHVALFSSELSTSRENDDVIIIRCTTTLLLLLLFIRYHLV